MDINILLSGAISGLIGVIGTFLILKNIKNSLFQEIKAEIFNFSELQKDEDFINFIYMIGGLIGKGAKTGIGMDKKMKPKDIIMQLILSKLMPGATTQNQLPGQEPRTPLPTQSREREPIME